MRREICNELAKLILTASIIMLSGCETLKPYLASNNNSSSIAIKHEANKKLEDSAIAGDPIAQNEYGLLYVKGEDFPQDYKIARKWFLASAKQGNHSAQANLAIMFEDGLGVPKNQPLAYALFIRAAESPYLETAKKARENSERILSKLSMEQTTMALKLGPELATNDAIEKYVPLEESEITIPPKPPKMSRYEQERNNRLEWNPSFLIDAAQNGDVIAQGVLGERHSNRKAGLRWLHLAASKGDPGALLELASTFSYGIGTAVNKQEALRLTLIAARTGYSSDAQFWAGARLEYIDHTESRKWLTLAAKNGHDLAALIIGRWYYTGNGVEKNYEEAIKWLRIGIAESTLSRADDEYLIGNMYYRGGYGIRQNYPEALRWFRLASNHGNHAARVSLGEIYANGHGIDSDNILAYTLFSCTAKWFGPDWRKEAGLTRELNKNDKDLFNIASKNLNLVKRKMSLSEIDVGELRSSYPAPCKELKIPEYSW